jgi:hypothetical protein
MHVETLIPSELVLERRAKYREIGSLLARQLAERLPGGLHYERYQQLKAEAEEIDRKIGLRKLLWEVGDGTYRALVEDYAIDDDDMVSRVWYADPLEGLALEEYSREAIERRHPEFRDPRAHPEVTIDKDVVNQLRATGTIVIKRIEAEY